MTTFVEPSKAMAALQPVTLAGNGVRLEPLTLANEAGLRLAAADGELWQLRVTSVPEPDQTCAYIEKALAMHQRGERLPFVVMDQNDGRVLGTTSYHDILLDVRRLEIGYTWYRKSRQRTGLNTICKWLLMQHAFEALGCLTVGWRTDNLNDTSQRAIERLGAKRDGVIRGQALRRDGSIRDTVMYSMTLAEWQQDKRAHMLNLLAR
jgi:N-acetyltransferase